MTFLTYFTTKTKSFKICLNLKIENMFPIEVMCAWMCMFWFRFSILAPAKIRPGTKLNILLEGQNLSRVLKVNIQVYDYPVSETVYWRDSVILKSDNNYSSLKTIEVNLCMNVFDLGWFKLGWLKFSLV